MPIKETTENEILLGLSKGESWAIKQCHLNCFWKIENHIRKNSGDTYYAKNIFQDALMVIIHKAQNNSLEENTNLCGFLFFISRRMWLKNLRGRKTNPEDLVLDHPDYVINPGEEDANFEKIEIKELPPEKDHQKSLEEKFKELGEPCQKIINMKYIQKARHNEIADFFGISAGGARVKLANCMKKLKALMTE